MQSQGELMQILGNIDAAGKALKRDLEETQEEVESSLRSMRNKAIVDAIATTYEAKQNLISIGNEIKEQLTEARDDLWEKLDRYLREKGGDVLVTSGFIAATEDRGIHRITSIRLRGRQVIADRWRVESADSPSCVFPYGDHPIAMPVVEFRNNATWAVVKGEHGEESFAVLLRDSYGKGRMWTLTAPGAFPDFYAFPEAAWNRIRQAFPVAGLWLEGAPRVSLFPYDNDAFILYPYVMEKNQFTRVRMHVRGAAALENPLARHAARKRIDPLYIQNGEAVFDLPARPGDYTIYRILR